MKKRTLVLVGLVLLMLLGYTYYNRKPDNREAVEPQYQISQLVGTAVDYTNDQNWMYLDKNAQHPVDLIYFYPTVMMNSSTGLLADIDDELKHNAQSAFALTGSAFSEYTNVFAPYYRQIPMSEAIKMSDANAYEDLAKETELRTDVYAALDLYFEKYNQNRPFILSGHSQGSAVLKMILDDYMKAHPKYLERMVAAYVIGYPITKQWLGQNPQLKFAEGETDIGVIISWNTEGPNAQKKNFVLSEGSVAINPLNWKRDETPAGVSENKGSLINGHVKVGSADATLDLKRGSVVCTTRTDYVPEMFKDFFGDKSFHTQDYGLYYENIKENGKKRIESYMKGQK